MKKVVKFGGSSLASAGGGKVKTSFAATSTDVMWFILHRKAFFW